MEKYLEFELDEAFDPELLSRIDDVVHGDNLTQVILHSHLLIERAMTVRIAAKLARPDVLEEGRYGRWSFASKLSLYVALYAPEKDSEELLWGFNKLRNMIAHKFQDENACIEKCLPWPGESKPSDIRSLLRIALMHLLMFELGAIKRATRIDRTGDVQH
jgi:hypothetical protein